ncbi:MAG TPA: FkbM family methyltransferase [Candidatus Dormibacteraeota bacterium]|nr:FkbM family methyltransferase [Candidatus Dormibacteraeota bacterium]
MRMTPAEAWSDVVAGVDESLAILDRAAVAADTALTEGAMAVWRADAALDEIAPAMATLDGDLADIASLRARIEARTGGPAAGPTGPVAPDRESWTATEVAVGGVRRYEAVVDRTSGDPVTAALAAGVVDETIVGLVLDLAHPGSRVLDLGAHVGMVSLAAASAGCSVIAVEASPVNAALLRSSIARNGFHDAIVVHAAVSDSPGVLRFVVHGPWGHVAWAEGDENTVAVPAVRADDLLFEFGLPTCDIVKMDVEGSEPQAFAGLERALPRGHAPAVLFESNGHTLAWTGVTPEALVDRVRALGYTVYRVEPGTLLEFRPGDMQPVTVADYLAVMSRPELTRWRIEAPLRQDEVAARVVAECAIDNADCRAYIGSALARFGPDFLAREDVVAALDRLTKDDVDAVRGSVRWWAQSAEADATDDDGSPAPCP